MADPRGHSFPPRGMRREMAAWYVSVGTTKFDEWVERGLMPKGKLVDGVRTWDRFLLDLSYENLPDDEAESPGLAPASAEQSWGKVK